MANQVTLQVEGMTCGHCVKSVENSVGSMNGVDRVLVELNDGTVAVEYNENDVNVQEIKDTIEDQGYTVKA